MQAVMNMSFNYEWSISPLMVAGHKCYMQSEAEFLKIMDEADALSVVT